MDLNEFQIHRWYFKLPYITPIMMKFCKFLVLKSRYLEDSVWNFGNHRSLGAKNPFFNAQWDFYASTNFESIFEKSFFSFQVLSRTIWMVSLALTVKRLFTKILFKCPPFFARLWYLWTILKNPRTVLNWIVSRMENPCSSELDNLFLKIILTKHHSYHRKV